MKHHNLKKSWGKPGNIAMLAGLSLTAMLGFSALVVDIGIVRLEKEKLQTTADAAVFAAVRGLNGTSQGVTNARNAAAAAVTMNDPNTTLDFNSNTDIVFGYWDETLQTFDTAAPLGIWNAARISLERSSARGNAITPVFSQLMGFETLQTGTKATAFVESSYGDSSDTTGVRGGHFDIDTNSDLASLLPKNCSGNSCDDQNSDGHVHEYDNLFNTPTYNARSPRDSSDFRSPGTMHSIQTDVGNNNFKIIIANAELSPGVDITVNGVTRTVAQYAALPYASLPTFNKNTLTELKLTVRDEAIDQAKLHRTLPQCSWANRAGKNGEWRNGALTVQAIKTSGTISTTVPKKGGQGVASSGMLHEIFMFWHGPGTCYSSNTWDAEWLTIGEKLSHLIK